MRLAFAGASSWFDRGAQIVFPSRLLASVARQQFSSYQLQKGLDSWSGPGIFTVNAWLASLWHEARYSQADVPALLSPTQERFLWQQVIEREQPHLFDIPATARLAQEAARLLSEWHIPGEGEVWNDYADAQEFQRWRKQFRSHCREEGWITRSDVWRFLPEWLDSGACMRKPTVFASFETLSPALDHARRAFADFAIAEKTPPSIKKTRIAAKSFASFDEEIESAARCSRARFEQQPESSVAVFVTDLASRRSVVQRIFQQVFYPTDFAQIPSASGVDSVFHLQVSPLIDQPVIASAFLLQKLAEPRIAIADAGAILRCPFITGAEPERSLRALAELQLRRKRELDVTLKDLEYASRNCSSLGKSWTPVRRILATSKRQQEFPEWSQFIGDLLEATGWPGQSQLNTREQEAVETWTDALSTLASLGLVSGPVPFSAALSQLRLILSAARLERGDWASPIQVFDASDTTGLRFDYAVLAGLSDENWPPKANSSPLIPIKLQRAHNVPLASPKSAQKESEAATRRLFGVAPEIAASYSGQISPIVKAYVAQKPSRWPKWEGKLPRQSYLPALLDSIDDTNAPAYSAGRPRGGTSLIKLQSLCPFRAFAERRLNAIAPEEGSFGLDSLDRGNFLHDALKNIWDRIGTQDRLKAIAPDELRSLINEVLAEVVTCNGSGPLHQQAAHAERIRLQEVIRDWLRVERERKQKFTVQTTEEDRVYEVAGLRLKLRIDRIDRLSNGKLVLIDYKSGEPSAAHLEKNRPREPQLLVYAAAVGNEVDGLFFAQLKPRDPRLVGYSRQAHTDDRKSRVLKNWFEFLDERRTTVEDLAHEFASGDAAVDPVNGACEYCQTKPFCRLNERMRHEEDTE